MNPSWVSIIIGLGSALIGGAITGAIWFGALKAWMARREEREHVVRTDVDDLEKRVRVLERAPPMDYARR